MKTTNLDPLTPSTEADETFLHRLSNDIGVLTALMAEAERTGHDYVDGLFARARAAKVAQAQALIARLTAGGAGNGLPPGRAPLGLLNGEQFLTVTGLRKRARQPGMVTAHSPFIIYCEETAGGFELRVFEEGSSPGTPGTGAERRFLLIGHATTQRSTAGQPRQSRERFRHATLALPEGRPAPGGGSRMGGWQHPHRRTVQ